MTIDIRYLQCIEFQCVRDIGKELYDLARLRVAELNEAQILWVVLLGFVASQPDDVVTGNACRRIKVEVAGDNLVLHVAFSTCNEVCPLYIKPGKRLEVHIGLIHRADGSGNDFNVIKHIAVVCAPIAD